MNIDKLKPGNVMNVRVAEDVMGWNMVRRRTYDDVVSEDDYREAAFTDRWIWNTDTGCFSTREWNPSYEIADAWRVVDKLFEHCIVRVSNGDGDSRDCDILPLSPDGIYQPAYVSANTIELAICRAALKVVNAGIEKATV